MRFCVAPHEGKAVSDPDIEGTPRYAGENINPITAHDTSYNLPTEYAARWIPVTRTGMTTFVAWDGNSADVIPALVAGIQLTDSSSARE